MDYYLRLAYNKFLKNECTTFDEAYEILFSYKYFRNCDSDILEYCVDVLMDYDSEME